MGKLMIGLDLGQAADYTALSVVELVQHKISDDEQLPAYMRRYLPLPTQKQPSEYHCRHLERFPLGTRYPAIVDDVVKLVHTPQMEGASLVVDGTGVGRAVIDMFVAAGLNLTAITITAGDAVTRDGNYYRVPKRDLVGAVQVPLQDKRLKFAASLSLAPTLIDEMLAFRVKITAAANDTYGSWREGTHDDLILSVMMATWFLQFLEKNTLSDEEMEAFNRLFNSQFGY